MADWKDFYEDNRERLGQYLDVIEPRGHRGDGEFQSPPIVIFCPLCHSAHTSEERLSTHLFKTHAGQHVYLRVNGRIVRDLVWTTGGIHELSLVLLGYSFAEVRLVGPGLKVSCSVGNDVSLKKYITGEIEGEIQITVEPSGGRRMEFSIFSRSLPSFRCAELDSAILALQERHARFPEMPNIAEWRIEAASQISSLGKLESRYLDGFYEYILAFHLEEKRKLSEAKVHFEEAFGNLLPFRTPLAHSAQCVLGLRMNCFGILKRAPEGSSVAAADCFFNEPFETKWSVREPLDAMNPFITYADAFTVVLVNTLVSYYAGDVGALQQGITALECLPVSGEKNHEDKLALLRARVHRSFGEVARSKTIYESLRYHPWFGSEAEDYLNGRH